MDNRTIRIILLLLVIIGLGLSYFYFYKFNKANTALEITRDSLKLKNDTFLMTIDLLEEANEKLAKLESEHKQLLNKNNLLSNESNRASNSLYKIGIEAFKNDAARKSAETYLKDQGYQILFSNDKSSKPSIKNRIYYYSNANKIIAENIKKELDTQISPSPNFEIIAGKSSGSKFKHVCCPYSRLR